MNLKTLTLTSASAAALVVAAPAALAQPATPTTAPVEAQQTPAGDTEVETVVVTGLRLSLQSAQQLRRNSTQIVDAIVAEDIGKLPDVTASDSLARVTGVQVERGGGEAGRVLVRGLPDITTTYNGRDIFTAEARFVAVQDFPAGGVAALEVYKSSTANLVEPGIAGLINVRSRRPFDFKGAEVAGGLRVSYPTQSQRLSPDWHVLLSDRWETSAGEFGALLNLSYTNLNYYDSVRWDGGFIAAARPEQVTSPNLVGFRFPDAVGIFYGRGDRTRPSLNASVQWRPNSSLELYFDALYQGFINKVSDRQLAVPLYGDARFTNVVLQPGGNQAQSLTSTGQVRPEGWQGATDNNTDTYQLGVGGVWTEGPWKVAVDLARTDSKYDSSIYSYDIAFRSAPTVDVNFNTPNGDDGGVQFAFRNFDTNNAANYVYRGFFDRHLVAQGDDWQFRTDVTYQLGGGPISSVDFGVRYTDRNGSFRNGERYSYQEPLGLGLNQTPVGFSLFRPGFEGDDVQAFRNWFSPDRDSVRRQIAAMRQLAGFPAGDPPFNPIQSFDANEKAYAGYAQVNYRFDGPVAVDGVVGLRAVKTKISVTGNTRTPTATGETFTPANAEGDYTDYLPSFTLRARLTDELQLRLAANRTRTRPNFNQMNPGLFVDPPDASGRRTARGGNVDLQPIKSDNFDAALEYYFSNTGSAVVTLFRRDVKGFIADVTSDVNDPVYGLLRVTRPENLNDSRLQGVEAAFTTFFDYGFMPEWAKGFGVQLNGTYIDSDGDLPGISKYSYNLVGMYERGGLSARLAYNNRTHYVYVGAPPGEYADDVSRLDFSASWSPIENVTLTFDASNILGDPYRTFFEYEPGRRFPRDVRYEETLYAFGIRFRL